MRRSSPRSDNPRLNQHLGALHLSRCKQPNLTQIRFTGQIVARGNSCYHPTKRGLCAVFAALRPLTRQAADRMLVDFTVSNFRSIKNEQLFSMYAQKRLHHHAGNVSYIDPAIGLLKTAAMYGANASGKTNFLLAIEALKRLVVESGDWKEGDGINVYEPYLLSDSSATSPIDFEIEFFISGDRYRYQIKFDSKSILFEQLDYFKTTKPSNIFTRNSPSDWKSVKFGDSYRGGRRQFAFFANNSYLAKAGNSAESPEFIRNIYNFFRRHLLTLLSNQSVGVLDWEQRPGLKRVVTELLKRADFGIDSFDFEATDFPDGIELPDHMPDDIKERFVKEFSKKEVFFHKSDSEKNVAFSKEMESSGTNRLFKLAPFITMVLKEGAAVWLDEIEASLHPHIAELVIKLFNDPTVNTNNAQLIFTTHDTSLMSQQLLRKDQVYLSSRSLENGTEIFSLDQFDNSLKDSSPFAKWYNEGRLGAIPEINYRDISESIKAAVEHA